MNVAALHIRNILGFVHFESRALQLLQQGRIVAAAQSRVRLFRGPEVTLNSQMKLHVTALKPAPAAVGEFRWLRQFFHS